MVTLLFTGCQTTKVGPRALRSAHNAYGAALTLTKEEQLLSNIVRMRYSENPVFLKTGNIVQNTKTSNGFAANFEKTIMAASKYSGAFKPGTNGSMEDGSNITFSELDGRDFIQKLMTPIPISVVFSMAQSGWHIDRVFNLCVERLNQLYNAPTASGPTPEKAPEYKDFRLFVDTFKNLHEKHLLSWGEQPNCNFPGLLMRISNQSSATQEIQKLKSLANLDPNRTDFQIKSNFLELSPKKVTIRTRSLWGMFSFAAQGVEVPQSDIDKGLVTVTKNADGSDFDWDPVVGRYIRIHCSEKALRPEDAFIACHYRNKWFYIAEGDTSSKTTFMLLGQFYNLQSAKYKSTEPVIVLSGN